MSNTSTHPIKLLGVFFVRNVVVAVPQHVPSGGAMVAVPENNLQVDQMPENKKQYRAAMRTVLNPKSEPHSPYLLDVECVGTFEVDDTLTEEEAHRGVTITAHSVLYGAIRESVAWITSRQVFGLAMLGLSVLKTEPAPEDSAQPVAGLQTP